MRLPICLSGVTSTVQYDRVLTVMSVLKGDGVKRVGLMVKSS